MEYTVTIPVGWVMLTLFTLSLGWALFLLIARCWAWWVQNKQESIRALRWGGHMEEWVPYRYRWDRNIQMVWWVSENYPKMYRPFFFRQYSVLLLTSGSVSVILGVLALLTK